ncbi:MAG: hypothetical protein AB7O97_21720 [Planctomycetota bacterium]
MIVDVCRWTVECDEVATARCYAALPKKPPCDCAPCRNFAATNEVAFVPEFRALCRQLGIDITRPLEDFHSHRERSGLHCYGGWFLCVGRILAGADARRTTGKTSWTFDLEWLTAGFEIGFASAADRRIDAFAGHQVLQVEYTTRIPWVIEDDEPD